MDTCSPRLFPVVVVGRPCGHSHGTRTLCGGTTKISVSDDELADDCAEAWDGAVAEKTRRMNVKCSGSGGGARRCLPMGQTVSGNGKAS